jgi:hypothetical protein
VIFPKRHISESNHSPTFTEKREGGKNYSRRDGVSEKSWEKLQTLGCGEEDFGLY